jgi:hypothetical protein
LSSLFLPEDAQGEAQEIRTLLRANRCNLHAIPVGTHVRRGDRLRRRRESLFFLKLTRFAVLGATERMAAADGNVCHTFGG